VTTHDTLLYLDSLIPLTSPVHLHVILHLSASLLPPRATLFPYTTLFRSRNPAWSCWPVTPKTVRGRPAERVQRVLGPQKRWRHGTVPLGALHPPRSESLHKRSLHRVLFKFSRIISVPAPQHREPNPGDRTSPCE